MRRSASEVIRNLEMRIARLERGEGGVNFVNLDKMQGYSPDRDGVLYCIADEGYGELKRGKLFIKDSHNEYLKRFFRTTSQFTKMLKQTLIRVADIKSAGHLQSAVGVDDFGYGMSEIYSEDERKLQSCNISLEQIYSPRTGEVGYLVKVNNGRGI